MTTTVKDDQVSLIGKHVEINWPGINGRNLGISIHGLKGIVVGKIKGVGYHGEACYGVQLLHPTPGLGWSKEEFANSMPYPDKELLAKFGSNNIVNIPQSKLKIINPSTPKKETVMSKVVDMVKNDTKEAAYRVAATQINHGIKAALVKLVETKMTNKEQMENFKMVLDSPVGESLIALILGYGLAATPKLKDDARVIKLSEEFRIQGMSEIGNTVVTMLTGSLMPMLNEALSAIPEETNARIAEHTDAPTSEENQEDEEAPKKARAN